MTFGMVNYQAKIFQSSITTQSSLTSSILPLLEYAFAQSQQLSILLNNIVLQEGNGLWCYIWGSQLFASNKASVLNYLLPTSPIHISLAPGKCILSSRDYGSPLVSPNVKSFSGYC